MEVLEEIVKYIFGFFNNYATQVFLLELPICFLHKKRDHFWLRFIPLSLLLLSLPYFLKYVLSSVNFYSIEYIVQFVFSLFIAQFCFDIGIKKIIFYSVSIFSTQRFAYSLQQLVKSEWTYSLHFLLVELINLLIGATVYLVYYFLFYKSIEKHIEEYDINTVLVAFCLIELFGYYALNKFVVNSDRLDTLYRIYDMSYHTVVTILQAIMVRLGAAQKKSDTLKQIIFMESRQYNSSKKNVELLDIKMHDLKHRINSIRSLKISKQVESELQEIENAISIYDNKIETKNTTLNIVLTEKCIRCKKHDINFTYVLCDDIDFIEEDDLYSLLDNGLDNAIDSTKNIDKEKRFIHFKMQLANNMLTIKIVNPTDVTPVFHDGIPISTKEGPHHGYGIKSMMYVAKKYSGTVVSKIEDDMFHLNIVLFNNTNQKTK